MLSSKAIEQSASVQHTLTSMYSQPKWKKKETYQSAIIHEERYQKEKL